MIKHLLFVVVFVYFGTVAQAATGDVLWTKCGDADLGVITVKNTCVSLIQAQNCNLNVSIKVEGAQVYMHQFDGIVPQLCADYDVEDVGTCNLCGKIKDNPRNSSEQCLIGDGSCVHGLVPLPTYVAGCFPKSVLSSLITCREHMCPNDCSGNGECQDGTCKCNANWYGDDCASRAPEWTGCFQVSDAAGEVCVKLKTQSCQTVVGLYLNDYQLYNYSFPLVSITSTLAKEHCAQLSSVNCKTCLQWSRLTLNETSASGCGDINVNCYGLDYGDYNLGCFEDDGILPQCWTTCLNNCSQNGYCEKGSCVCYADYQGDDCSIPKKQDCKRACGPHATCKNGVCVCLSDYEGEDCATFIGEESNPKKGPSKAVMVVVPLFIIIAIGLVAGGVWYYINVVRKKQEHAVFHHLDLLEESSPTEITEEEMDARSKTVVALDSDESINK